MRPKTSRVSTRPSVVSSTPIINDDRRGRLKDGSDGNHTTTRPRGQRRRLPQLPKCRRTCSLRLLSSFDGNNSSNSNCKCHTSRESEDGTRLIAGSTLTGFRCKQNLLHYWGDQGRRSQARKSTQVPVLAVWLSTLPWSLRDLERAWAPFQESSAEWDYLLI